ncbi:vasotab-TY2-like [Onthophagus taurus]|uniref:vasotab-TY2-like n=1 Tax=Onthophagus taurus TaxID=166361 RepID=UPI000C2092E3|nr:turripeptide Pal9.2-like [Onthophagus taurus]
MKVVIFAVFLLVLLAAVLGSPAKGSTKPSLKKKCLRECPLDDYNPVCGTDDNGKKLSFGNECVLSNYNCEQSANLRILSKGECPGGQGIRLS